MTSLEDAYINIAKAEEKLHEGERQIPEFLREDDLESNELFQRYLKSVTNPTFFSQTFALMKRRLLSFRRDPRMIVLLVSPFLTTIMIFMVVNGLIANAGGGGGSDRDNRTFNAILC